MSRPFPRWLWLLLPVVIVAGLMRLRFDVEVLDLLPPGLPAVQGLKIYQQHFANGRELIVTVSAPDPDQAEAAAQAVAERLRAATNLAAQVTWQPPWLERPAQAAELLAYLWFNQPPEIFSSLTNRLAPEEIARTLAAAREQLATSMSPADIARLSFDPLGFSKLPSTVSGAVPAFGQGEEFFSSGDGTFRIVYVQAATDLATYRDCRQWLGSVKEMVRTALAEKHIASAVVVNYTGRPAFVAEISSSMEHDITLSVGGTALIIAALFWIAHRRWKPMLWLLTLLALILAGTLALGGLVFGTINVISMGFAAILLGLAVDYAVVHYQEALAHPELSVPEVRRAIAPSILWAAITTISAFLVLNFGGLPGLGQLGSLVGLGVALSACVMIFFFLPPLFPERMKPGRSSSPAPGLSSTARAERPAQETNPLRVRFVFIATVLLIVVAAVILWSGIPGLDVTANALRPRGSAAYAAFDSIQKQLHQLSDPLWLLIRGRDERAIAARLDEVESVLNAAVSNGTLSGFKLPVALWPRPELQAQNRVTAKQLSAEGPRLRDAVLAGGFTSNALAFTDGVLATWNASANSTAVFWPTNAMSRWLFEKFVARSPIDFYTLGLLYLPAPPAAAEDLPAVLESKLPPDVLLSGWGLLGTSILSSVKSNLWKLIAPMVGLVLLSLWFAFRRPAELLLSVMILLLSGLCLLAVMRLAGWSWNLLNLMSLPLILGTGVDYSIFMQLALRRHHGDLRMAHRSVGRALLLCGGTAIAGFGALAFSSNAGMASLGAVCAVGIAGNVLISVFLLPVWWKKFTAAPVQIRSASAPATQNANAPSSLYRAEIWRFGLRLVRILPRRVCLILGSALAKCYWAFAADRRRAVVANLLPALRNDRAAARRKAKDLFRQFAVKIVDLWRYEAGLPIQQLLGPATGWEHLAAALAENRGVLLLTPHLGNWEFGGPSLKAKGVALLVITLDEPGERFTELRRDSRARWNIETLVIGDDPFAFVEIIRRLEAGATVALLIDRPPPHTAVTVELFGRPFAASVAAAELARASGCVLLPVYLPREGDAYVPHVLPAIPYQRAALRDPAARQRLTQQIVRAFEPAIQQHADQWYHFIPIWPK